MKEKPVLLEYELRQKSQELKMEIYTAFEILLEKQQQDNAVFGPIEKAYFLARDISDHFVGAKWNRDIKHDPSEKQNQTKGF